MPRARVALLLLPCVAAYVAPRGAHCAPVRVAPRAAALAMSSAHRAGCACVCAALTVHSKM